MKLPVINGLRGLAICCVVFHHSFAGNFKNGLLEGQLLDTFLCMGWSGVNLFFMVSGFVLYLPYARGDRMFRQVGDVLDFYKRRFGRLLPLYWFIVCISIVFVSSFRLDDLALYGWFATLFTTVFPFHSSTFRPVMNGVLWSIGVEIWFSVLFPLLVLLINRFRWRNVLTATLVMSLLVRLLGNTLIPGAPTGEILNAVSDSVFGRLDEFLLGMLLAHFYMQQPTRAYLFSGARALLGILSFGLALFLWGMWFRQELPAWSAALCSWPMGIGMFFVVGYLVNRVSVFSQIIEAWPLQMLGMMCYSIYLWHGIVLSRFHTSFTAGALEYVAYLCFVMLLSCFTYRYIEFGRESNLRALLPQR